MDILNIQFQTREKQYFYIVPFEHTPDSQIQVFPVSRKKPRDIKKSNSGMSTRQGILIHPWVRFHLSLIGEVTIPIALTSKPCEFESRSGEVYRLLDTTLCDKVCQ